MAIEERRRIELFERLTEALGREAAATLSDLLPPRGGEIATRGDVDRVGMRLHSLDQRMDSFEHRMDALDLRMDSLDQRMDSFGHRMDALDERMDSFEYRMDARLEATEERLGARIDRRITEAVTLQTRTLVLSQLGALVAIAALAFGLR